jgi:hypothetical protein
MFSAPAAEVIYVRISVPYVKFILQWPQNHVIVLEKLFTYCSCWNGSSLQYKYILYVVCLHGYEGGVEKCFNFKNFFNCNSFKISQFKISRRHVDIHDYKFLVTTLIVEILIRKVLIDFQILKGNKRKEYKNVNLHIDLDYHWMVSFSWLRSWAWGSFILSS